MDFEPDQSIHIYLNLNKNVVFTYRYFSTMESMLICSGCNSKFNLAERQAKILPCFCVQCLKCLKGQINEFDEYNVTCKSCDKEHTLTSVHSLLTSELVSYILSNSSHTLFSEKNAAHLLESFNQELSKNMNAKKLETNQHYESTLIAIENRTKRLIEVNRFKLFFFTFLSRVLPQVNFESSFYRRIQFNDQRCLILKILDNISIRLTFSYRY